MPSPVPSLRLPLAACAAFALLLTSPSPAYAQAPPEPTPSVQPQAPGSEATEVAPLSEPERAAIGRLLQDASGQGLPLDGPAAGAGDPVLIAALLRYASWQHGGRLNPAGVNSMWGLQPEPFDARAGFDLARREGRLLSWLDGLTPSHAAYQRLLQVRRRYAALVAAGGFPRLDRTVIGLRVGSEGPAVAALRARLAAEGFVAAPMQGDTTFDDLLAAALDAFRATRRLPQRQNLGAVDLTALNEPASATLARLDLNLERERWIPREVAQADRVEVNIPATALELYQGGAVTLQMRTVVGKPSTQTPMFSATIRNIVFNPPWVVPASIARNELSRRSRAYLASRNIRSVDGRFIQAPGEDSALGVLKFDFANRWGVYLHDTGAREAFAQERRFLSHGCVRLQQPRELAAALLASQGWTRGNVETHIARRTTHAISLARGMPLLVVYRTATVGADGALQLFEDVYGWDARLARALAGN